MHYSFLFAKRVSLVIGAAYILTPVALSADPSALLERWPMDEQTGNVISGVVHALNGTLVNGPQWTRSCLGSGALSFDGQNDYAELGTPTELLDLPQSSFSIVMWIKTMDLATRSILIGNYDGDPAWNLEIHTSDQPGHLRLYLDGEDHHDDVSVADGQWHHIAAVRDLDAGQVTLYIDGQIAYSQASAKGAFSVPAGRPTRLARDSRADLSYEGWMDDVRLYTAALTQDDVFNIIEEAIQDSPLGTYTFPAIPPKTVWHGSTYSFLVQWPDHEGALFDLWATPQPTGQLSLERVLHTDTWMVSYTPDQSDVLPFEVILGGYGFETVKQSFELLPMAHLAPEQEVFDISNHTGPGPFGSEEVVEHVSNGIVANINYQGNKQLKRVELIGKTILWEDTPAADDLFDFYNGKLDQESITLTAETVIIRSALHFPQTNVTIHARQLRFEGASAQIKTTPIDNPVSYPGDQNPGSDGRSAGNIELNINTFYTSHNGIKFALNGSRGQDGGRGHDGDPGRSVSTYWTTFNFNDSGIQFNWTAPSGEYIIFKEAWNRCAFGIPILAFRRPADGAPAIPTNGHNAVSSGKPGKGGAAGHLKTTLPAVAGYVQTDPGNPGNPPISGSWYYGGAAGTPRKWLKMKCEYCLASNYFATDSYKNYGDGTGTKAGANAPVPQPDGPSANDYGYVEYPGSLTHPWTGNPYVWMDPVLMRSLFNEAKDAYLSGDLTDAQTRLEDLSAALEEYGTSGQMALIADMDRFELNQLYDHMKTLLYQIENNLDYFGHPAGWVPMLSFEVNLNLFNNEIDRAIEQLYLVHWVSRSSANSTDKLAALQELRVKLQDDIDTAYEEYETARSTLTSLEDRAADVKDQARLLILDLQALEVQLATEADNNLTEPWWKTTMKTVGLFCKYVPVFQPVTGAIGGGLDIAANYDPDDPYTTVIDSFSLADSLVQSTIKDTADAVGIAASVATGDVGDAAKGVIEAMGERMPSMTDYVKESVEILQDIKAPVSEIRAEMDRLKAQSPEFKALAEKIEALMELQAELARDIAESILAMTRNANIIRESLMAMDALQDELANVSIPDDRALQYLQLIERRAFDRLLLYHYYVAKSYEYRMLEKYTQPLDLEPLFTELATNTQIGHSGQIIPQAQFDSLKAIYTDIISSLIHKIASDFNATGPSRKQGTLYFELTQDELNLLNAGRILRLNLFTLARERFPLESQDVRILNIAVQEIQTSPAGGSYEQTAFLEVILRHQGLSRLMQDGHTYQFQHFSDDQSNPFEWGTWYYPALALNEPVTPSPTNASLIYTMLTTQGVPPSNDKLMLYAHPAVWADVDISIKANNNAGKQIHLDYLLLAVQHDFTRLYDLADIRTEIAKFDPAVSSAPIMDNQFLPYIVVDRPSGSAEISGRTSGRGPIHRVYNPSVSNPIHYATQRRYGDWKFCRWTDQYNSVISTDRILSVVPDTHKIVRAQFCPLEILPGDLNHDCIVDNRDILMISDSWRITHGRINIDQDDTSGIIDMDELRIIVQNWLRTCHDELETAPPPSSAPASPQERYMELILD